MFDAVDMYVFVDYAGIWIYTLVHISLFDIIEIKFQQLAPGDSVGISWPLIDCSWSLFGALPFQHCNFFPIKCIGRITLFEFRYNVYLSSVIFIKYSYKEN